VLRRINTDCILKHKKETKENKTIMNWVEKAKRGCGV
jgi:hypothetical protein